MTTLSAMIPVYRPYNWDIEEAMWAEVCRQFVHQAHAMGEHLVVIGAVEHVPQPSGDYVIRFRGETMP